MQVRRVARDGAIVHQVRGGDGWSDVDEPPLGFDPPFRPEWELERAGDGPLLPFTPLTFRDFLLFEQHNVDASRGYLRRFSPPTWALVRGVEQLTRRDFPALRPGRLWRRQPIYYQGNSATVRPAGGPVRAPGYSRALDFELELGFVLRAPLLDATPAQAEAAIGGFVLVNDLSARDVQRAEMGSGFGLQKSKHFLTTMATTAVTPEDVLPRVRELTGRVEVNGEVLARPSTKDMRWSLGEVLAHASRSEQLLAGELLATGTLPGGSGMELGRWLAPGDHLRLVLDGVGELEHDVV